MIPQMNLPKKVDIPSHQPSKMTMPELEEREQIVKEGKETFVKVGLALLEIREGRGYKLRGFATFEEYCQSQFDFSRRRGYQLMEAAQVAVDIKSVNKLFTVENESQARDIKEIGTEKVIEQLKPAMSAPNPVEAVKSAVRDIVHKHREEKRESKPGLTPRRAPLGDAAPDAAVSTDIDFVFDDRVNEQRRNAVLESKKAREYPVSCPCGCGVWSFKSPPPPSRFIPTTGRAG